MASPIRINPYPKTKSPRGVRESTAPANVTIDPATARMVDSNRPDERESFWLVARALILTDVPPAKIPRLEEKFIDGLRAIELTEDTEVL